MWLQSTADGLAAEPVESMVIPEEAGVGLALVETPLAAPVAIVLPDLKAPACRSWTFREATGRHLPESVHLPSRVASLRRRLAPDSCGQALGIGDADPEGRVLLEPDDLGNLLDELDAEPGPVIGTEREAIVGEAEAQPDRGIPAVILSDQGVVDIAHRRLHLDPTVRRQELPVVGEVHTVGFVNSQGLEQQVPTVVEAIWKEISVVRHQNQPTAARGH